ncbi:MAG TPA: hypothetical protein PKZ76_15025 [Xanthomonadaceae bacterium]|nr:hypothetical protein [Xanthomonadaceae bacterium]
MRVLSPCSVLLGPGLALALLCAGAAHAQTLVHFGNFAPRDSEEGGRVSLRVGDTVVTRDVPYGALVQGLSLPHGSTTLTLLDASGEVIAQRDARLLIDVPYTVYAAGNGIDREVELRVVAEPAQPLRVGQWAVQLYSAALHPVDPLRFELSCGLLFAGGSLTFGRETIGRGILESVEFGCSFLVQIPSPGSQQVAGVTFPAVDARLQRIVLLGDGRMQPWQLTVFEGVERPRALVEPDAGMDGLWFDPSDSGSGLTILVEPEEQGEHRVAGVLYGYDLDGAPTWALLEGTANRAADVVSVQGMLVLESVGGRAQGDRQPVRMRLGIASLDFHSCREATLFLFDTSGRMPRRLGRRAEDGPQQVFRLQRLLPIDACLTAAQPRSARR